jgi:alkanesulfonate monooxygenase SsuD/methylene tetrahydromethanopterin reductase-like flavin-dependent oxidoreductase (luciferase family)
VPGSLSVYARLAGGSLGAIRDEVRRWEELGVSGLMASDHLFGTRAGSRLEGPRPPEPLTLLAAAGTFSDRLHLGTSVSNASLLHPALLLRQFAQLAVMFGGERVLAGIGAGWNRPEFDALGMRMPGFAERMDRLEEAAALARQLFDRGYANLEGRHVRAYDLPLSPAPEVPPRLLLGGGSVRLLEIAGRYADIVDLNGSPQAPKVSGQDLRTADRRRRLSTTVSDLEVSGDLVSQASWAAGRPADAVERSIFISEIVFCSDAEVPRQEEILCANEGLSPRSLDACPYALLGTPRRMAALVKERRERLGLTRMLLGGPAVERFCLEVLPLLGG